MKQFEDMLVITNEQHDCPHKDKISKKKFKCDNLILKGKEYKCSVCKCPYDGLTYSQKESKVKNGV